MGADIYSRILFGARITLTIAMIAVGAALLIGVPIGLISGWRQSWFGETLMRVSDIFLAVPQIVLAIAIAQTLGPSIENIILALSITYWPWFTRLVHAEVRSPSRTTFIEAAIALLGAWRIILQHVLPNVMLTHRGTSIGMGFTILTASALGFPLPGGAPPAPEWGRMISNRANSPEAWVVVCAGAGACHLSRRDGLQPPGRRLARRPRSADPTCEPRAIISSRSRASLSRSPPSSAPPRCSTAST
jgi:peptide/nickel transport system permease protein